MELRRYLSILRRRAFLIILTGLVGVVVAYATSDRTATYTAQSTLYVGASQFNFNATNSQLTGDQTAGLIRITATFATMIDSEPIAQDAIELTGLPLSANGVVAAITAQVVPGTSLLRITAIDTDPRIAQELATGIAEAFVAKIKTLEPGTLVGEGDVPIAPVSIFERAQLPTTPAPNSALSGLIVAGLFGVLFASGCVLLLEYLDVTVKSAEDAERRIELPVLAAVPLLRLERPTATPRQAAPKEELDLVHDA
jgi:capsular polysaccharide biosynthesis protein